MAGGNGRHFRAGSCDPRRHPACAAKRAVAGRLTITAAYWFTSSTSFANPAVTLARGFTTTFSGIAINHVPGFIAAQLLGAAAAAGVCAVLFSPSAAHAARELR